MFIHGINFAVDRNTQLHRNALREITSAYRKTGWGRVC